jgi:hypothetical protein
LVWNVQPHIKGKIHMGGVRKQGSKENFWKEGEGIRILEAGEDYITKTSQCAFIIQYN